VLVDAGTELDFLDLDRLLLFARLGGFLLRLVFEFAVIEDFADGRADVGRNLDEVEARLAGQRNGIVDGGYTSVRSILVDQLNLANADIFIDARPVFLDRRGGSPGATNGSVLLSC
jgi:hypothetical protein